MEPRQRKVKKKIRIKKERTLFNVLKKRLSRDYWKVNILILVALLLSASVVFYVLWTMPLPKKATSDNSNGYENDYRNLNHAIREHKGQ